MLCFADVMLLSFALVEREEEELEGQGKKVVGPPRVLTLTLTPLARPAKNFKKMNMLFFYFYFLICAVFCYCYAAIVLP